MKRLFLIYVATFALGVVVAVVLRARQHQPYAPASIQVTP